MEETKVYELVESTEDHPFIEDTYDVQADPSIACGLIIEVLTDDKGDDGVRTATVRVTGDLLDATMHAATEHSRTYKKSDVTYKEVTDEQ